jgi:hypothetical protein
MMTGWEKFIFNIHSSVALLFSCGCLYIIGTKLEDKFYETWWGKLIVFFIGVALPVSLVISIPTKFD